MRRVLCFVGLSLSPGRLAVILLAAFVVVAPALPTNAAARPQPPTDVLVAWTQVSSWGEAVPSVKLMWGEPDGATYEWAIETLEGTDWTAGTFSPAPSPDSVSVPGYRFPYRSTVRMVVRAVAAGVTSAPAASPAFDTHGPDPKLTSIAGHADGSLHLTWVPQLLPDSTPNDPLDVIGPAAYQLVGQFERAEFLRAIGPTTTALTDSHTPTVPGLLGIAPDNEWRPVHEPHGERWVDYSEADYRDVWLSELSASVPPVATYSLPMTVTGRVSRFTGWCTHLDCNHFTDPDPGRRVVLHARNRATSAWYAVTSTTTDAKGLFRISVKAPGTREYRVLALGTTRRAGTTSPATAGAMSAPRTTTAGTRLVSARFVDPTATRGQKVTASLRVLPGGTQRVTLQRWTGTAFVNLKWVYLVGGVGSYTFTAVQPGTVGYRYVVPASVAPNGLAVMGTTSKPFYLSTR